MKRWKPLSAESWCGIDAGHGAARIRPDVARRLTKGRNRVARRLWQASGMRNFAYAVIGLALLVALLAPDQSRVAGPGVAAADAPATERPDAGQAASGSGARVATIASAGETVLERQPDGHFYADAQVNGRTIRFMIDTGATSVALTRDDAARAGVDFDPSRFDVVGTGASGPVRGQRVRIADLRLDLKQAANVDAAVLDDGLSVSLLGQSFLSRLATVQIERDRMILR